jgi:signal transduction histidine kinase
MRTRLLAVALTSSAVALVLFLIPLAFAVFGLNMNSAQSRIESEALNAALSVDPAFSAQDHTELPAALDGTQLGLYDPPGRRVLGSGPARADKLVTASFAGRSRSGTTANAIIATVPLTSGETVTGVVRASTSVGSVWQQSMIVWLIMAIAAAVAILVGVAAAIGLSRRITRPIRVLAASSAQLGEGDFTVRIQPSGIAEIDQAARSLNATAERLGDLVQRERSLSAHASHQLRTPLAGLRVLLEDVRSRMTGADADRVDAAIGRAGSLEKIIDEIISLSREPLVGRAVDAAAQLDAAELRWRSALGQVGRSIAVEVGTRRDRPVVVESALHQVLDVLIDNALRHGSGRVVLRARSLEGAVAFDVEDEGADVPAGDDIFTSGTSGAGSSGLGLAFARRLVSDQGGRLLLSARQPHTRFTAIFPSIPE